MIPALLILSLTLIIFGFWLDAHLFWKQIEKAIEIRTQQIQQSQSSISLNPDRE